MKTMIIALLCAGVSTLSALAGSCPGGGCGDKDKEKEKDKEAPKESAYVVHFE